MKSCILGFKIEIKYIYINIDKNVYKNYFLGVTFWDRYIFSFIGRRREFWKESDGKRSLGFGFSYI